MPDYNVDEDEKTDIDDQDVRENQDQLDRDNFLKSISQLESSGGQNLNHPVVQNGVQAGQQAVGQYGLMPNTMQELMHRQGRAPATSDMSDPALQQQLAEQLADKVLNKYHDPEMAAYSWNHGHNLSPEAIKERHYQDDPYVQKFKQIRQKLGYK